MTDTDRMVVWLRETMDAAGRDAEAVQPDSSLSPQDPVEFILAGQDVTTSATEAAERFIRGQSPVAVLRRIAADRRAFERHQPRETLAVVEPPNKVGRILVCDHDRQPWPCPDITDLAEGWGWTEETP